MLTWTEWIQICNKADSDRKKNSKQVKMYLTMLVDLRKKKGKGIASYKNSFKIVNTLKREVK